MDVSGSDLATTLGKSAAPSANMTATSTSEARNSMNHLQTNYRNRREYA